MAAKRTRLPKQWLEGLTDPRPIRCRGAFNLYSAKAEDGSNRVVVVAAPDASPLAAQRCIAELARVHALVADPLFPDPDPQAADRPFAVLRSSAICDGEHLMGRLRGTGRSLGYPQATAFVQLLGDGIAAAHRTIDPLSRTPITVGSICWSNFLFSADGQMSFVGLGYNIAALTETGSLSDATNTFRSPEVAAGSVATPGADLYAATRMFRSVIPFVDMPKLLRRAFDGEGPLLPVLQLAERGVLSKRLELRPGVDSVMRAFRRTWRVLRVTPDVDGFRRLVAELLDESTPARR